MESIVLAAALQVKKFMFDSNILIICGRSFGFKNYGYVKLPGRPFLLTKYIRL